MTPWRCAEEIADFLREEIKSYDEKSGTGEAHAGFLPIEAEKGGAESLYHVLEFLRFSLLSKNPIKNRWQIAGGELETSIPDEQPYPKYWGRIDFDVILPIVKNPRNDILGRM